MTGHIDSGKRGTAPAVPGPGTPLRPRPNASANDPVTDDDAAHNEERIGPLLARANLLRIRGQWDEAVAACTEALRKVPESPSACSLLGDIYEAQGKYDDALQWYGMAVDFDPENKADRAKLERVVEVQRQTLLKEEQEAQSRTQQAPKKADPAERTLEWFDRVFPPGKQEGLARFIILIGVVIFLVLVTTAAIVQYGMRGAARQGDNQVPLPQTPGSIVVTPDPEREPDAERPAPRNADTAPQPAETAPPIPAPPPSTTPTEEAAPGGAVAEAVRRSLPAEATLVSAQTDARNVHLILEITLAAASGETPDRTRERILRTASAAVRTAATTAPSLQSASVRIALQEPAGGTPPPAPQLVFQGDAATAPLRQGDPATLAEPQLRALFSQPLWAPHLAPAPAAPQP